jgi:hypothetical protein
MFASIKYRPITISRLAIPESSDGCARRAVQRRRMSAFGALFRVQERRGWVGSCRRSCLLPSSYLPRWPLDRSQSATGQVQS